jgi:hypothetical protein
MRLRTIAAAGTALALASLGVFSPRADAVTWAPAPTAAIHPGVMMDSASGQCTANFVYTNGSDVLLGFAAHCVGTGGPTDIDGCVAGSLPIDTPVTIQGATQPGRLVYSSWLAMQFAGETDDDACLYNDLGLVKIAAADVGRVNPSIPHWGGPTGLNTTGNPALSRVYSYGNSSLRQGLTVLSPKTGVSVGTTGGGWTHPVYTVTPGIPGDSGSAFLDASGRATGVLSTLALAPLVLSNNVGDLNHELNYARTHGLPNLALALGTEPFTGTQLPLGL